MYKNFGGKNISMGGWSHHPSLENTLQGQVMEWHAPENGFPGAADGVTRPWKWFLGAVALPAPAKSICSCEKQGQLSRPPLEMPFYPPQKRFM
jgi:hypothetical protein